MGCVFFNDTATTDIYTLSLHDALPISNGRGGDDRVQEGISRQDLRRAQVLVGHPDDAPARLVGQDRKSTRLNSSHANISYAVFCLKKTHTSRVPFPQQLTPSPLKPSSA